MSDSRPVRSQEPDTRRSWQGRIVNTFRSQSSPEPASGVHSGDNGPLGLGITNTSEPDARTRLLESYDRSNPVCGERRCSHGTFSPQPESAARPTISGASNGRLGHDGTENAGAASNHLHPGDYAPESRPDSVYMSQMKSSFSGLSMNENKTQYAESRAALYEHPSSALSSNKN